MKVLALISRILLGLVFVVFGANGVHPFLPMGNLPAPDSLAGHYFTAFMGSGLQHYIGAFQVLGGLLVLFGGTLPLGLCILCPITVNILLFHMLFHMPGILPGALTAVLELILIYAYRDHFAGILTASAKPQN